jgi:hypothetical protein
VSDERTAGRTTISPAMRAAVGGELGHRVSYPVSDSDIRRWALAVHHPARPPARYWDPAAATAEGLGGIVAPLEFNPFPGNPAAPASPPAAATAGRSDPDRLERLLGIEGPGLAFVLNGGMSVGYGVRMRPGDVITSVARLGGYTEREGRLGLMLFTTTVDEWSNSDGDVVKRSSSTLIRY